MIEQYHVRLEKQRHVFCAAHFITYGDDVCEPLHGHNYHVAVEVAGPLEENQYVVDFMFLTDELQQICNDFDHTMLLPTDHPTIRVQADDQDSEIEVTHGRRRWVFPKEECRLLPVVNTTAEQLARYIGGQLLDRITAASLARPERLTVEVDECDGQKGIYSLLADDQ